MCGFFSFLSGRTVYGILLQQPELTKTERKLHLVGRAAMKTHQETRWGLRECGQVHDADAGAGRDHPSARL